MAVSERRAAPELLDDVTASGDAVDDAGGKLADGLDLDGARDAGLTRAASGRNAVKHMACGRSCARLGPPASRKRMQ